MVPAKFLSILLVFGVILSCSCLPLVKENELKPSAEEMPDAEMIQELDELLTSISYPKKYEMDVFDCSNETAYMYDFLTGRGYECDIILGAESIRKLIFGSTIGRGHAWIIAKKYSKKFWIEATSKIVSPMSWYDDYFWKLRFHSLEELKQFWKFWNLPDGEWDY